MGGGGGFDDGTGKKRGPTEVPVGYSFSGEAWVARGGSRTQLTTEKEGKVKFRSGDRLVTGNGFIWDTSDSARPAGMGRESADFAMFPNSELELFLLDFEKKEDGGNVLGQMITGISLLRGLFWVHITSAGPIEKKLRISPDYPEVEFKPTYGEFGRMKELRTFIDLSNGALTVFSLDGRLVHKGLGVEARNVTEGLSDGKITATKSALYATNLRELPDQRAFLARKLLRYMMGGELKSGPAGADDSALYSLPPLAPPREEDRVVKRQASRSSPNMGALLDEHWNRLRAAEDEMVERRLAREKEFREEYEGAPESVREEAHREIKLKNEEEYLKYSKFEKQMREELLANEKALIEAGKKTITATTRKSGVGGKVAYHEVDFEFAGADRGIEMGLSKSKPGGEYLMLKF